MNLKYLCFTKKKLNIIIIVYDLKSYLKFEGNRIEVLNNNPAFFAS